MRRLALPLLCSLAAAPAAAQEDRMRSVDSVLDRLEQRLLDQEADGHTFSGRVPNASKPFAEELKAPKGKQGKVTRYQFDKAKIEAQTPEQIRIKDLGQSIAELENQVDQLASTVQKTKQSILDEAKIDNFIEIEAALPQSDNAAIRALTIKLDGYPVYELHESAGLWLPSTGVPLYAGPLQPGPHRLDLEARIALRDRKTLPVSSDVYHFVNKTFDLQIPGGTVNARYVITLTPPVKPGEKAEASMKEAD